MITFTETDIVAAYADGYADGQMRDNYGMTPSESRKRGERSAYPVSETAKEVMMRKINARVVAS